MMLQENVFIELNLKCSQIPDQPYRTLNIGDFGLGKTITLPNLIRHQSAIGKIYLYLKNSHEAKYQFLINNRKSVGLEYFHNTEAFIKYSNNMNDIYKIIDYYNSDKTLKIDCI